MSQDICFRIEAPIAPNWPNIELLRTSVLNCLASIFQDSSFCDSVSMITSELLENAVKYGDWDDSDHSFFKLRVSGGEDQVQVHVSNPVDAGSADLKSLLETVEQIGRFENPALAYQNRLKEIAERGEVGVSRLGLPRIAFEGNCDIKAEVVDGVLHIRTLSRN